MATPTLKYVAPTTPEDELTFAPEPVVIYGVPGGGDSGIQSIVAGDNVTVDDSDPQNPIVSATGGGGEGGSVIQSPDGTSGVVADNVGVARMTVASNAIPVELGVIAQAEGRMALIHNGSGIPVDSSGAPNGSGIVLHADLAGYATATQGAKADTAVQPAALSSYVPTTRTVAGKALSANVTLAKADVGLSNVDNTADSAKPVSTVQQTALDGKVPTTRTVAGKALTADVTLAKGDVGLGNVDNTSDANKPVSSATQTALNAKVNTADVAGLNTVGWGRAVFIPNGGTVPGGTPAYTIVIEAGA